MATHSEQKVRSLQNLLPRDAYDKDETGYWTRMPIVIGPAFGFLFAIGMYFTLRSTPHLLHPPTFGEMILIGLLSGLLFGIAFPRVFRQKSRRMIDRLYSGDENLVTAPSSEGTWAYRLPCTWVKEALGVGGVLYVGSSGLLFVPHKINPISITAFRMAPLRELQVQLSNTPQTRNLLQRALVPHPQPLVEIVWPSGRACFLVPSAATTAESLTQVCRGLQTQV